MANSFPFAMPRPRTSPSSSAGPAPKTTPIPTKQQAVYEALRSEIMDGHLQPGEVLVIDSLARRFQVSIIPVREALRQLQAERLVEIQPHTGVRVTPVDISALPEIFALLGALETASALHALAALTAQDLEEMEIILARLEATAASGDSSGFEQANRQFHLLPCRIAGFTRAEQGLRSILAEWEQLHRLAFQGTRPPNPEQANKDHRAIVRAFRHKDAEKLAQLIQKHNATALSHYQRLMKDSQST